MNYRSFRIILGSILWLASLLAHTTARAEDTDLFVNVNGSSGAQSNLLFIVDNAAAGSSNAADNYCNIDSSGNVTTSSTTANATALSGTTMGTIQCALYSALSSLSTNADGSAKFNMAIMVFNSTGQKTWTPNNSNSSETGGAFSSPCSGGDGGCLVVPMTGFTTNTKKQILWWIKNWTSSNSGSWCSNTPSNCGIKGPTSIGTGAIMQEAWAYFKGYTGVSGRDYSSIKPSGGCTNVIVYLGNAYDNNMKPNDQTGDKGPKNPLTGVSGTATVANPAATSIEKTMYSDTVTARYSIPKTSTSDATTITCSAAGGSSYTFTSSEGTGVYALNWAKYLYNQHAIRTYSIGLLGSDCKADYPAVLDRLAEAGSAQYFPTNNYATLADAIKTATSQIISVNTVFASVSLPVSVNTQGSYLNQVYIGMFRPTSGFLPRWNGNLKQYKLAFVGNNLKLVDADGSAAIDTTSGFIDSCKRSYWTPSTVNTYWQTGVTTTCSTVANSAASDYPDGNVVEKGGAGYMLRRTTKNPDSRTVKTCGPTMATCGSSSSFVNFTTSLTTDSSATPNWRPTLFGFSDNTYTAARDNIIQWARGQNDLDTVTGLQDADNEQSLGKNKYRASVHGDVVHSRPVAINHGDDSSPQVVVYYGTNDGMLRAVNGNKTDAISGVDAGDELWSFMPPEFYSKISRQYINTVQIKYQGTTNADAQPKDYGMDGPFTAFSGTISGTAKKYLFATMRRGGRAVYAFDVTTPASPSLLWKIGCSSSDLTSTDCTSSAGHDYTGIGQTWGSAKVFYATAKNSGGTPLLLMAGGYDTCEDTETGSQNHSCTSTAKGTKVYVIDATTGENVASFPTEAPWAGGNKRPIIADATMINDSTGKAKYAYIADLGGVVYRLDFTGNSVNQWSMTAIAKLGCATYTTACSANRKFMFQPSVVSTDGTTFYILLGSGDREKPVSVNGAYPNTAAVSNYFFMIKDKPTDSTWLTSGAPTTCGVVICIDWLQQISGTSAATGTTIDSTKKGWYLTMQSQEQIVTSAVTVFGVTSFSTHTPAVSTNSCSNNLGTTRVYNVNYADATSANGTDNRYEHVAGDGLPPSPVAGKVLIDGATVPFCIGCSKDSPLEGKKATQATGVSRARNRLYWYVEKQ